MEKVYTFYKNGSNLSVSKWNQDYNLFELGIKEALKVYKEKNLYPLFVYAEKNDMPSWCINKAISGSGLTEFLS